MSKWIGILWGDGRKSYVAGKLLRVVEYPNEARVYDNPSEAYIDARALKDVAAIGHESGDWRALHPWITEVSVEQVGEVR